MPALMAGLAGVTGVHGHQLPALVSQTLLQLAPVAGQDAAVQAGLGLDVGAGLRHGAFGRLGHAPGIEIFHHHGMGLVGQGPADVVGIVGADPFLLAAQFLQLAPDAPRPDRAALFARPQALQARPLGSQVAQVSEGIQGPLTVGDLPHVAVQPADSRGRAGPHGVRGHRVGQVGIPLGPRPRPFLPDPRLPDLPVGIGIAAPEPQPADPRHPQLVGPHLYLLRDGEAILAGVLAFEVRVGPLPLQEAPARTLWSGRLVSWCLTLTSLDTSPCGSLLSILPSRAPCPWGWCCCWPGRRR